MEAMDEDLAAAASETSHLLLLLAEPSRCGVRQVALDFVRQGLRRWDASVVGGADLSAALDAVADAKPKPSKLEGDESVSSYSGFGVSISVVFNCRLSGVRRHLSSTFRHARYALVIFAGSCDDSTGAWILADGVFSPPDLDAALRGSSGGVSPTADVEAATAGEESSPPASRRFHLHLPVKGGFLTNAQKMSTDDAAAAAAITMTVTDASDEFQPLEMEFDFTSNVMEAVEREVREPHENSLLSTPGPAGALSKKDLTVYVFPAEDGDCFLVSVRGFTMLVNGGHAIRSCFWPMVGSLDSLDVLAITHLGQDNILGLSTLLSRKLKDGDSAPQIDHLFFNALERPKSGEGEINGVDDASSQQSSLPTSTTSMGVSLASEGKRILDQLHSLDLSPHPWVQAAKDPFTPIQLYCKIGFGRLCMYLINPTEDGPELSTFLAQWKSGTFDVDATTGLPTPDEASVAFVLIWYPDDKKKVPTRLLYPGRCSAEKLTRGLDRLKDVDAIRGFDGKPPPPKTTEKKSAPSASKPGSAVSKEKSPRPSASAAAARRPGVGGRKAAEENSGAVAAKKEASNGPSASNGSEPTCAPTSPSAASKKLTSKPAAAAAEKKTATAAAEKKPAAAAAEKKPAAAAAEKKPSAAAAEKKTAATAAVEKKPAAAAAKSSTLAAKKEPAGAAKKEPTPSAAAPKKEPTPSAAAPKKEPAAAAVRKDPAAAAPKKDTVTAKKEPVAAAAAKKDPASAKPTTLGASGATKKAEAGKKDALAKSPAKKEATPKKDAAGAKKDAGASPAPKKEVVGAAKPGPPNGHAAGKAKSPAPGSKASGSGKTPSKKDDGEAKKLVNDVPAVSNSVVDALAAPVAIDEVSITVADPPIVDVPVASRDGGAVVAGEPVADAAVKPTISEPILDHAASLIEALGLTNGADAAEMDNADAATTFNGEAAVEVDPSAGMVRSSDSKGADAAAAEKRIGVAANLDADELAERARAVLSNGGDLLKGVSPPPSIEITECESAPDSDDEEEEEDLEPPIVEEQKPSTVDNHRSSPVQKSAAAAAEPEEEPEMDAASPDSLMATTEGFGNVADTPTSISSNDILFDRIASDVELDDGPLLVNGGGAAAAAAAAATTTKKGAVDEIETIEIAPPAVSNPLSGDESWEASSPESLSPNAPADGDFEQPSIANFPLGDYLPTTTKTSVDAAAAFIANDLLEIESPDVESGFAELSAAVAASNAAGQMSLIEGGIESKEYRALVEISSDSDSLLTHSSPMEDFDPFSSSASPLHPPAAHDCVVAAASPCVVLAPEMTGLSLDSGDASASSDATSKGGAAILMDDLLMAGAKEGSPFADAASAGSSSGKESSPFGSNGFPEAQAFNELVQQQQQVVSSPTDDFDPISPKILSSGSVLSAEAPAFNPPSSFKATSPGLSIDAPPFVPTTIPEEEAAAIVDGWGPPLGLPPAKPAPGAKPKTATGAKPRATTAAAARPGTTGSRRAASPASSTASGSAARKTGATARKGAPASGSAKSTPPPPAVVPFFVDVAYVPMQGKPEALGKFFTQVRANNYVVSCVDSPAATLDALLDAKENDWKVIPSGQVSTGGDGESAASTIPTTNIIPTHEGETLRSWIPKNLERMKKLAVEITTPAEKCTLQLQGHGDVKSACYVIACN